ncbi:diacylglycerol/lipid kinase family protein [Arcticibacter eurypsychrophilus]|uniref:diacylglycerol/lipid kinase family protein n=1 Tax=Arcticibacter eurypsychrophilus TaxID=1434752 RepID=UPI00084DDB59|nr:diacylglycerol kinase family protein [Arcticibacter eurypsychrophilus]
MKVLFVVNTKSGSRLEDNLKTIIQSDAENKNYEYQIYDLPDPILEKEILKKINLYKPDVLAAAGGDGTINLIASLIHKTPLPLLIIPTGSANGMASELKIGNKIDYALSLLTDGVEQHIDVLKINNKICIHLADVGLNARIVKRFEEDPERGIWIYAKYLFREVFLIKKNKFIITIDGKKIKLHAVSLTFANASKYGTGAVINPIGKIDDGKFELVVVKPFPRIKLLSIAWKMFTNNLHTSEYVQVYSCSKLHIHASKSTTLQIDGEIIGKVREIQAEIISSCLTLLVPPPVAE